MKRYCIGWYNFNLGLMWHMNGSLTLGAVLKTPFTADVKHKSEFFTSLNVEGLPPVPPSTDNWFGEGELDMPMSYGLGVSYRFSDVFTVSADLYRTQWDDFIRRDANGTEFSPINDKPVAEADIDPTHQVRLGMEYLIIDMKRNCVFPLRSGIFYDPAPAEGSPDDYFGLSLGTGIA